MGADSDILEFEVKSKKRVTVSETRKISIADMSLRKARSDKGGNVPPRVFYEKPFQGMTVYVFDPERKIVREGVLGKLRGRDYPDSHLPFDVLTVSYVPDPGDGKINVVLDSMWYEQDPLLTVIRPDNLFFTRKVAENSEVIAVKKKLDVAQKKLKAQAEICDELQKRLTGLGFVVDTYEVLECQIVHL